LAGGLVGEGLRGARDPLVGSARCDGDRTWLRDGDGGIERRYITGVRGSKGARAYSPRNLTPKRTGEGCGFSPGLELDGGSGAEASTVMSGGGVAAALVEKEMQREPGRLDPSDRCAVLL